MSDGRLGLYVLNGLAAWINGGAMPTAPVSLKLALSTIDPGLDGSALSEPVNDGYLRQTVAFSATVVPNVGVRLVNIGPVVFGPNTADTPWPPVIWGAVLDQAGNFITAGPLGVQRAPPKDDTVSFGAGACQFLIK